MTKNRIVLFPILASILVSLSGCDFSFSCSGIFTGDISCQGSIQGEIKKMASGNSLDQSDLATFDARNLYVDTSNSNVSLKTGATPTATVYLTSGKSVIHKKRIELATSGPKLIPSHPNRLSSFIRNAGYKADGIRIDFTGVRFASKSGNNAAVVEWIYDDEVIGGVSDSIYMPEGRYCDGGICYEPK